MPGRPPEGPHKGRPVGPYDGRGSSTAQVKEPEPCRRGARPWRARSTPAAARPTPRAEFVIPTTAAVARRAAELRARSGVTDLVDSIVVAKAATVGGSIVLTSDPHDIRALIHASGTRALPAVGV